MPMLPTLLLIVLLILSSKYTRSYLHVHTRAAISNMITDAQLYSLAIFLGSAAMMLIVLYHFLEVNSEDHIAAEKPKVAGGKAKSAAS